MCYESINNVLTHFQGDKEFLWPLMALRMMTAFGFGFGTVWFLLDMSISYYYDTKPISIDDVHVWIGGFLLVFLIEGKL